MQNWKFTFAQLAIHFRGGVDEQKIPFLVNVGVHDIPYSQVGIIFEHELSDNQKGGFDLFAPVDLANLKFQDT